MFSGASDDLLYLVAEGDVEIVDVPDAHQLGEISYLKYGGWIVTPDNGPPFMVQAHYDACWSFAVGMPPDAGEGAPIGVIGCAVDQDPECPYSTRLVIDLDAKVRVEATNKRSRSDQWTQS